MLQPDLKSGSGGGQTADTLVHHEHRLDQYENLIQQLYQVQQDTCTTLNQVSHRIVAIDNRLGTLFTTMQPTLSVVTTPRSVRSPPLREPEVKPSELFDGNTDRCGGFLLQCNLAFARSPSLFPSHAAKVIFLVAALKGRALRWAQAFLSAYPIETLLFDRFVQEFRRVFDHPLQQEEAAKRLLALHQDNRTVADFSVDFRITVQEAGWDELALKSIFVGALSDIIKDQLSIREEPTSLDELISLAIRIDNRIRERQRERGSHQCRIYAPSGMSGTGNVSELQTPGVEGEPMQVGRTRLSAEERQRRFRAKECIYCGRKGHFIANCPFGETVRPASRGE
uniref:CCHC-type domain-containing protein n=1 Tax=Kryptolebias marmoratus TaxID=37003 RepID=A0A3Q3ADG8_KRYMA